MPEVKREAEEDWRVGEFGPVMAIDKRTIAELEKDGFTHIDARYSGCGRIVQMPFGPPLVPDERGGLKSARRLVPVRALIPDGRRAVDRKEGERSIPQIFSSRSGNPGAKIPG